jgi:hypothetical protein
MGEGIVDWQKYFERFSALCPEVPVNLEIISGFWYGIPYLTEAFWTAYPKAKAADFAHFIMMAKKGKSIPPHRSANQDEEKEYQKAELERSLKYCREVLKLGLRN